jgi:hypothetical protein
MWSATLPAARAEAFSRGATPVAREHNPTRHARKHVLDTPERNNRAKPYSAAR